MQPQKRDLEQRSPVRESRHAGARQTPPKRTGQQRDAPVESPEDGTDWWRVKLRPLLQRADERGLGAVGGVVCPKCGFSRASGVIFSDSRRLEGDGPPPQAARCVVLLSNLPRCLS